MNQFCEYCGGDWTIELPCICSLIIVDNPRPSKRKESIMNRIRKWYYTLENRIMNPVYNLIDRECFYMFDREITNLAGYKKQYALTGLDRVLHVTYSVNDSLAYGPLKNRILYALKSKPCNVILRDTMRAFNNKLESYKLESIKIEFNDSIYRPMKGQYLNE